ncbi:CRISPR-associated protein Cas2 [Xanthomonas arboricola]|uniref:CRISPR-associated protein Cas2 n=1 Tax=Xanthomonas arboricola TaxID=56448 RepID=UPI0012687E8F|nr:CRISPR-associated protein Cas2 [Xanthomonas arboricola]
MNCYIVTFQAAQRTTRDALRERMKAYDAYCPINATCWALMSDKKAVEIRDDLKAALAKGDRIFIIRSGTEAAWKNAISQKHSDWLKKNL